MARQGLLLRWRLDDLLWILAGGDVPPLDELREEFLNLLTEHKDGR